MLAIFCNLAQLDTFFEGLLSQANVLAFVFYSVVFFLVFGFEPRSKKHKEPREWKGTNITKKKQFQISHNELRTEMDERWAWQAGGKTESYP